MKQPSLQTAIEIATVYLSGRHSILELAEHYSVTPEVVWDLVVTHASCVTNEVYRINLFPKRVWGP